jgi:NADPH:quinone reductase-like Zn-dependent oxidoreductase
MAVRMQLDAFGGPEVLHEVHFEPTPPGEGEVLIRNVAIGVNPFEWKLVAGLTTGGKPQQFPLVPGTESAGIVEAAGDGAPFEVGDAVIARHYLGAFASHRTVPAAKTWPKPPTIGFEEAAALTVAAGTAWAAIAQVGVGPGDTVLVHNASGGVGSAAVQIAKYLGARVIGTTSAANFDYLRELGAEPVPYGDSLVDSVRALGGVTAVVDFHGDAGAIAATLALLPDLARAVSSVSGATETAGIAKLKAQPSDNVNAIELAAIGALVVDVAHTFSLADAGAALALSRSGHSRGKIVLVV